MAVSTTDEAGEAIMELLEELFGQPASLYTNAKTGKTVASVFLARATKGSAARQGTLRKRLLHLRQCGIDIGTGRISMAKVRREDWAESWKRHFKAIAIGQALLIKPSWIKRKAVPGQAVVVLDPGLSFGTGQHPTTRFCLEQLVAAKKQDTAASLLDMGTGSGILAIAGVKLGYQPVAAFDFDPAAVRVARANAQVNGVAARIRPTIQDLTRLPLNPARQFDVICANLICDLLVAERSRILARLKPGGRLVLAGILKTQFPSVRRAYQQVGLTLIARHAEHEWESGAFAWK
jgi:ribosomal protein L11 methyltransferase